MFVWFVVCQFAEITNHRASQRQSPAISTMEPVGPDCDEDEAWAWVVENAQPLLGALDRAFQWSFGPPQDVTSDEDLAKPSGWPFQIRSQCNV